MSTQAILATVGGPSGSKVFSDTSTDGQFDSNNLLDTIGSADLGQVMGGSTIDHVCVTYTAGSAIWRIQSRNTLKVSRFGYASKVGTVWDPQCKIASHRVGADDILTVYPLAVDATSNQTALVAWVKTSKGTIAFAGQNIVDSTATEITTAITSQSLGEYYGSNLQGLTIQLEDGASLTSAEVIGADGGTIVTWYGTVRDAGHYYVNLDVTCNIPIEKGTVLKVTTVTA
uniref:Uncharacterized protein n=1 Tax=uncultured marine group II/III euryarchaeote KM3_100_D04 TaxID=1457841 RepID=A0A075G5V1_9EURY|nr:hypothetical protein [uncultured marine group II/III euryarchaeote KM3_100_D04]